MNSLYAVGAVTQEQQAASDGALLTDAAAGWALMHQLDEIYGAPLLDPDGHVVAMTWQDGWSAFYDMLPAGAVIRSNEAMQGWKAARAEVQQADVDYA